MRVCSACAIFSEGTLQTFGQTLSVNLSLIHIQMCIRDRQQWHQNKCKFTTRNTTLSYNFCLKKLGSSPQKPTANTHPVLNKQAILVPHKIENCKKIKFLGLTFDETSQGNFASSQTPQNQKSTRQVNIIKSTRSCD